ncbi:hypothetical protein [Streptomyces peucetius]|uniref:Uncharacterized protein n=1 Tax=Streptomyces peucetius TaxID=1950 RepID=A0ABY6I1X4_STRPE|nr:hypothetical protein [Streptomyces peucetius]UYQ60831.1 hypothetical protein OGH68_04680 [Streptomyces peucetius]
MGGNERRAETDTAADEVIREMEEAGTRLGRDVEKDSEAADALLPNQEIQESAQDKDG